MAVQVEAASSPAAVLRAFGPWLRRNVKAAVFSALLGCAVGYVANVWLMAVEYNGYLKVPPGAPSVGEGNVINGGVFWALASTVLFGIFGYYRAVGWSRFAADIRGLPGTLRGMLGAAGTSARINLLWGAASSLLVTSFISPSIGAVVGVGLLASAPGLLGRIVVSLCLRVWQQVISIFAPARKHRTPPVVSMAVGIVGAALALLAGALIPTDTTVLGLPARLPLALVCGLAAFVLGRSLPPASAVPALLIAVGLADLAHALVQPLSALATDGGMSECAGQTWITCQGATGVLTYGFVGAAPSGGGAVVGSFLGQGLSQGGWGSGGPDGGAKSPDGGAPTPTMPDAASLNTRIGRLNQEVTQEPLYSQVQQFFAHLQSQNGAFSPADLATLISLEQGQNQIADQRLQEIRANEQTMYQDWQAQLAQERTNAAAEIARNQALTAQMAHDQTYVLNHVDDLPPAQAQHVQEMLEEIAGHAPNQDDANHLRQILQTMYSYQQGQSTADAAIEGQSAAIAGDFERTAQRIQTAATVAEVGLLFPGMPAAEAGQALGSFYLGRNAVQGMAVGYFEHDGGIEGIKYGLLGGAEAVLPINTAIATGRALAGDGSVSEVGWGFVRDVGNMLSLQGAGFETVGGDSVGRVNMFQRSDGSGLFGTSLFGARPPTAPEPLFPQEIQSVHDPNFQVEPGSGVGGVGGTSVDGIPIREPSGSGAQAVSSSADAAGDTASASTHPLQASLADDNAALQAHVDARAAVDEWKDTLQQVRANPDDAELAQQLRSQTNELNADMHAKGILKSEGDDVQKAFIAQTKSVQDDVVKKWVDDLNTAGYRRGGRPFTEDDFYPVRNATSKTVGMDLDLALNQRAETALAQQLADAEPGSQAAHDLQLQLLEARSQGSITYRDPTTGDVSRMNLADFRDNAQNLYEGRYMAETGQDAEQSFHSITTSSYAEAYADPAVLANNPRAMPFDPALADQTGSVTSHKMNELLDRAAAGQMPYSDAIQETARGTAKDISTKLEPLLESKNMDPDAIARAQDMRQFLSDVGSGKVPITTAQSQCQDLFGTNIEGLVGRTDSMMSAAIKFPPRPDPVGVFGHSFTHGEVDLARGVTASEIRLASQQADSAADNQDQP